MKKNKIKYRRGYFLCPIMDLILLEAEPAAEEIFIFAAKASEPDNLISPAQTSHKHILDLTKASLTSKSLKTPEKASSKSSGVKNTPSASVLR